MDDPDVEVVEKEDMAELLPAEGATGNPSGESTTVSSMEGTSKRKEFAMVVFHNIPENYPADAHIECGYTITSDLIPTRSDWVGLYKVGWLSTKDYIYYDWANIPSNYEEGKDAEGHVLFPAHKLPDDDGEFYQFCYVTSSGQIRGASTPFQFKKPSADDFIEIEDDENEMLVIRSKTIVMEENLRKLEDEKSALLQLQHELTQERDELINKLFTLDQNLQTMTLENKHLSDQVKVDKQTIIQLQQEAKDLIMVRDEVQQKAESVKKDREDIQERVSRLDDEINSMREAIKKLQNEKDKLEGENETLKKGIEMFKQHFSMQEGKGKESLRQIEELQITLAKQESLVDQLKSEIENTKAELEQTQTLLSRQQEISQSDKENIEWLSEKIQNLEDKLSAADNVKQLLQEEIHTYKEHNQKMSRDLEACKEENHCLREAYSQEKETLATEAALCRSELDEKDKNLAAVKEEVEKLKTENEELARKLEEPTESSSSGSMQCLVMAQGTLKERYSKMEHNFSNYQTESTKKQKEFKQRIKDMGREIEDLKERLTMGSNEYRNLYVENRKLQKKVEKLERKRSLQHQPSETGMVTVEHCQRSLSESMSSATEVAIETKIHDQLNDVGRELGNRQEKKLKYKMGLIEERKKTDNMKKELEQNKEEIEKLKKELQDVQNQSTVKVRSLENYVAEKDKTIDELNRKIRDTVNLHDGPCKVQSSEGCGAASSLEKPKTSAEGNNYQYMVPLMYPGQGQGPIAFPAQGRSPLYPPQVPLVYPHPGMAYISPPAYPRLMEEGQSAAGAPPLPPRRTDLQKKVNPDDAIPETDSLDPPLQPLPAPMIPERLMSAKKAEIANVLNDFGATSEGNQSIPTAPPIQDMKEERFEDAPGEGMKICPVCSTSFSADVSDSNFEAHILAHVGRICPLCHNMIDNCTDEDFEHHVNKHLDQRVVNPQQDTDMEFD